MGRGGNPRLQLHSIGELPILLVGSADYFRMVGHPEVEVQTSEKREPFLPPLAA